MSWIDDVLLVGMLLQISLEEGADRDDLEAPLARNGQARLDERCAQPLAAVTFGHDRMIETDRARQQVVLSIGELGVAEVDLELTALWIVADGWLIGHCGRLARKSARDRGQARPRQF